MSLLKSIAVPTAVVGAVCGLLAASAPSDASGYQEGTIAGYQAHVLNSGSYSGIDYLDVAGPKGVERITVICAPYNWHSTGPNSVAWVELIANAWCFS